MSEAVDKAKQPDEQITTVFFGGELEVDNEIVPVQGESGKRTIVELRRPVKLGNALTVGTWLNDMWKTPVPVLLVNKPNPQTQKVGSQKDVQRPEVEAHLAQLGIPEQVHEFLATLLLANVYITDLYIDLYQDNKEQKRAFKFGTVVDFNDGLTLFGEVKLKNVALGIISRPESYKGPKDFEELKFAEVKTIIAAAAAAKKLEYARKQAEEAELKAITHEAEALEEGAQADETVQAVVSSQTEGNQVVGSEAVSAEDPQRNPSQPRSQGRRSDPKNNTQ
jgi:hypothetical protein